MARRTALPSSMLRRTAAGLGAAALITSVAAWTTARSAVPAASANKVTISVNTSGKPAGGFGSRFMGLSFESSTLNNGYRYDNVGNLTQLLLNLGSGVMRFGGDSADTTHATTNSRVLDGLNRLTRASGWSVLWTENLVNFNAAQSTADTKAVNAALGSKLFAMACGNEPDMYVYGHRRPPTYTVNDYIAQVNACYRAIRQGGANAPVEGPDTAWNPAWLATVATKEKGTLTAIGQHYYPLGCVQKGVQPGTLLPKLLSSALAGTEAKKIAGYVIAAKPAHVPLRLTETNSACNGGVAGLSNAYASALWVIDFTLASAQQGVTGMNFQGGLNTLCDGYTVLCQVGKTSYSPHPIYYGMLFARLLGAGKFLPVTVSESVKSQHVAAFALRPSHGGKQRIMVDNMGSSKADITLRAGGFTGTARVLRLTGPAPLSTSGVKIQGASVAADGTLTPGRADNVTCTAGSCKLTLSRYSAALVTLG